MSCAASAIARLPRALSTLLPLPKNKQGRRSWSAPAGGAAIVVLVGPTMAAGLRRVSSAQQVKLQVVEHQIVGSIRLEDKLSNASPRRRKVQGVHLGA